MNRDEPALIGNGVADDTAAIQAHYDRQWQVDLSEDGRMPRRASERKRCIPPTRGTRGDVWQCGCGRRWTCTSDHLDIGHDWPVHPASWGRRYWPWPRS